MANTQYWGTGRRKTSVARVRLLSGNGKLTVNDRDVEEYFDSASLKQALREPLVISETADKFDIAVNVHGGGTTGQSGAIRHGISRALIKADPELRPILKKAGFLTRDSRMKERKKYGFVKARKSPQFSKR